VGVPNTQVTLFTRGKTPIATQIPDDTPESFAKFKAAIKHVAGDRLVRTWVPHLRPESPSDGVCHHRTRML
jgi:hypothetical protein